MPFGRLSTVTLPEVVDPATSQATHPVYEYAYDALGHMTRTYTGGADTTGEHPFYVDGKGWTVARDLAPGDLLVGHDGKRTAVDAVDPTGRQQTVYNVRVAQDHTYFVGHRDWGFSVWVHNRYNVEKTADGVYRILDDSGRVIQENLPRQVADDLANYFNGGRRARAYDTVMRWLDDPQQFKAYLTSLIDAPPEKMPRAHAHHILFKRGFGPKQQELVREAQDILWAVGINPIFGSEVLVWAPRIKGLHVLETLEPIVEALRKAAGDYDEVVKVLKKFGEEAKYYGNWHLT